MKKITLILMMLMLMMVMSTAEAAKSGDRIARADYTDMSVYINQYPIESYMVGGYAVIPAEELANYCCDVVWSEADWALYITKSETKQEFTAPMVYRSSQPGKFYSDVYKTDIRCIINGTEVPTFNINGRIFITIDDFGLCMDEYTWADNVYAAKAWLNGKPIKEYKFIPFGTELLYLREDRSLKDVENWTGSYDLNYDGKKENIRINLIDWREGHEEIMIDGNKRNIFVDMFPYIDSIEAIYACDVDSSDGVMDLVIIFRAADDACLILSVIRYDENLSFYSFPSRFGEQHDFLAIGLWGYLEVTPRHEPYFKVLEDGLIMTKRTTHNIVGEWSVMATYMISKNVSFKEVKPQYYEILPEYMDSLGKRITGYEKIMWNKGYIKAYETHYDNITVYKGEYFKVLYDDGNDRLYIVKENGQAGWITIPHNSGWGLNALNRYFFLTGP